MSVLSQNVLCTNKSKGKIMLISPISANTNCKKNNNVHFKQMAITEKEIKYIAKKVTTPEQIERIGQYGDMLQRCKNLNFKFGTYDYGLTLKANRVGETNDFATMHEHKHQSVESIFQKCARFCEEIGEMVNTADVNATAGEKFSERLKKAID